MPGRILVLGAAGRLGRIAAEAFRDSGWTVASLTRGRSIRSVAPGTEPVEADARNADAVVAAARGADVILDALNPPYTHWSRLTLPLTDVAIAAARAAGATLIFPGNLYNYGRAMPAVIDETTPMHATSHKGVLRIEAEGRLRDAAAESVRSIVLRAGDFYGGGGLGSWFDRIIVKELGNRRVTYPGPLDVVHEWAYLPDLAAAMVALAEARERLEPFAEFGFAGHAVTGAELVTAMVKSTGRNLRAATMPWWLIRLLSPVVPIFRELSEIAYLWTVPHRIAGDKLKAAIGDLPATPFPVAVTAALAELGAPLRR